MKKKFAIVTLMGILICSSFYTRVEAADTAKDVAVIASKAQEMEDEKITLELLEQMTWEELVNTAHSIEKGKSSKEDFMCITLIETIEKSIYDDPKNTSFGIIYMSLEKVNYERLMKKYQSIIDCHNNSNKLQLVWEDETNSDNSIEIDVQTINNLATEVGQQVKVKAGTTYWESAYKGGTGNKGVTTNDNVVTVNGVAYIDESGKIVETYYKPYKKLGESKAEIKLFEFRMLHICTGDTDLGWVYVSDTERAE